MTLYDYLKLMETGDELTVFDTDYDIEVYFFNQCEDFWDEQIMKFAQVLEVKKILNHGVEVNFTEVINKNLDEIKKAGLFNYTDEESIVCCLDSVLAGNVSEEWMYQFVKILK